MMKKKRKHNNTVINAILGVLIILTICCNLWWPFNGVRPPDIVGDVVLYYDSDEETMMLFRGGLEGEMGASRGLWKWEEAKWTPVPLPDEIPRFRNTAAYDRKNSRLIVVNGEEGSAWAFKHGEWTPLPPSGPLGVVFYNPVVEQIWAGEDGAVYALKDWDNTWEKVTGWEWPVRRTAAGPVYDPNKNRAIVYASTVEGDPTAEYLYEIKGSEWGKLGSKVVGFPGIRGSMESTRTGASGRASLVGIVQDERRNRTILITQVRGEFAIRELIGDEIREATSENVAPYRWNAAFGYNPKTGESMMYGGYVSSTFGPKYLHDTWSIKYVPERDVYVWRRSDEEYADLPTSTDIQRLADTVTQGLPPAKVKRPASPPGLPQIDRPPEDR